MNAILNALVLSTMLQAGDPEPPGTPGSLDLDISAGMMQPEDLAELADDPNGFFLDISGMADFYSSDTVGNVTTASSGKKRGKLQTLTNVMTNAADTGAGFTFGGGYNFMLNPSLTLSVEGEFGYHIVNTCIKTTVENCYYRESGKGKCGNGKCCNMSVAGTTGSLEIYTIMLNASLHQRLIGDFGVYGGGGLGVGIVDGNSDFAWHVLAGVEYAITDNIDLYAGPRFTDPGVIDFVSIEAGLRINF